MWSCAIWPIVYYHNWWISQPQQQTACGCEVQGCCLTFGSGVCRWSLLGLCMVVRSYHWMIESLHRCTRMLVEQYIYIYICVWVCSWQQLETWVGGQIYRKHRVVVVCKVNSSAYTNLFCYYYYFGPETTKCQTHRTRPAFDKHIVTLKWTHRHTDAPTHTNTIAEKTKKNQRCEIDRKNQCRHHHRRRRRR